MYIEERTDTTTNAASGAPLTAADGSAGGIDNPSAVPASPSFWDGFSDGFTQLLATTENSLSTAGQQYLQQTLAPARTVPAAPATSGLGTGTTVALVVAAVVAIALLVSRKS